MVRKLSDPNGRQLLDPNSLVPEGKTATIVDMEPSWNGKYVAVGMTPDGSRNLVIRVVQVSNGKVLTDIISRTVDGDASWNDDDGSFYYRSFQNAPANSPPAARFDNMRAYIHRLGQDPTADQPVFGPDVTLELHLPRKGFVNAFPLPGTALQLSVQSSAPTELDSFWIRNLTDNAPKWRQIADHKDNILFEFATRESMFFYVTTTQAPNGRVMAFDAAKQDVAKAREILPQSDLVLSNRDACGVVGAHDALYVYGLRKGAPVVVRIPYDDPSKKEEILLPANGSLSDVAADYRVPGFVFTLSNKSQPSLFYKYDPGKKTSVQAHLE